MLWQYAPGECPRRLLLMAVFKFNFNDLRFYTTLPLSLGLGNFNDIIVEFKKYLQAVLWIDRRRLYLNTIFFRQCNLILQN